MAKALLLIKMENLNLEFGLMAINLKNLLKFFPLEYALLLNTEKFNKI